MLHDPGIDGGVEPQPQPAAQTVQPPAPAVDEPAAPQATPTLQTAADAREIVANDAGNVYRVDEIQGSLPQNGWAPDWLYNGIEQVTTTGREVAGTLADGAIGVVDGLASPVDHGPMFGHETAYNVGKLTGATAGLAADASVMAQGFGIATGGVVVSGTGGGAVVGVPAAAVGTAVMAAGAGAGVFHAGRFNEASNQLLASVGSGDPTPGPSGRTLVVGGGNAPDYPGVPPGGTGLNIAPGARPHVVGDGNVMPIRDGTFSNVVVENIAPRDFSGRGMISESYRVLEPNGNFRLQTGARADPTQITAEMRNAGFRNINVGREYGGSGHPLDFRYVITAVK